MTHWLCGAAFRLQELSVWARVCVLFKGKALYPELDGPCQSVQASALWRSLIWLSRLRACHSGVETISGEWRWAREEVVDVEIDGKWRVVAGAWCTSITEQIFSLWRQMFNYFVWATQDTILESEGCFIFYFLICKDIQCYTVVPLKSEQNYCLCKHCVAQILMCPVRFLEFIVSVCVYFWSFRITWAQLDLWPYLLLHRWMGSHLFEVFS